MGAKVKATNQQTGVAGTVATICLALIALGALAGAIVCFTVVRPTDWNLDAEAIVQAAYSGLAVNTATHDDAVKSLGAPSKEGATETSPQNSAPGVALSATQSITSEWTLPPGDRKITLVFEGDKLTSKKIDPVSSSSAGWLVSFLTVAGTAAGGIAGFTYAERKGSQVSSDDSGDK